MEKFQPKQFFAQHLKIPKDSRIFICEDLAGYFVVSNDPNKRESLLLALFTNLASEFNECLSAEEMKENGARSGVQSFCNWIVNTYRERVVVIEKEAFSCISIPLDAVLINVVE